MYVAVASSIVLLDVALPDTSGIDLIRRVREADGLASRVNPATPMIVVSALDTELDRVRAFEAGTDDHVGKPFSYAELRLQVQAVASALHEHGLERLVLAGENTDAIPALLFGSAYAGATFTSVNYRLPDDRLRAAMERVSPLACSPIR